MKKSIVISLETARNKGLKYYFTNNPCKRGHISKRLVSDRACHECKKERRKPTTLKYRIKYREKLAQRQAEYRKNNPEKVRESNRKSIKKHAAAKKHRNSLYRARKIQRTPPWMDAKAIQKFYELCPKGMHVDHIIPLKGKNVSGLHVLENLQYLSAEENLKKTNSFSC